VKKNSFKGKLEFSTGRFSFLQSYTEDLTQFLQEEEVKIDAVISGIKQPNTTIPSSPPLVLV